MDGKTTYSLQIELCNYFDIIGITDSLQLKLLEFKNSIFTQNVDPSSIFYYPIFLCLIELADYSEMILDILLEEPEFFKKQIEEIIFSKLKSNFEPYQHKEFQLNQIVSPIIILKSLFLPTYPQIGLTALNGIVAAHTLQTKYLRRTRWKCDSTICEKIKPTFIKPFSKEKPVCLHCGAPLNQINPLQNDFGTIINVQLINIDDFNKSNSTDAMISLSLKDQCVCEDLVQLGAEVTVLGVKNKRNYETWGFTSFKIVPKMRYGNRVEALRDKLMNDPWIFVQTISEIIGGTILPKGTFMHLRTGLLLSLASTSNMSPISILAVYDDVNLAEMIMDDAASLAGKCVRPLVQNLISAEVNKEWKIAGSMALAANGLLYLGEWKSSGKNEQTILESVETGNIKLEGSNFETIPLKSAIWTYFEKPKKNKNRKTLNTLIKVFGLSWNDALTENEEEDLIDNMLYHSADINADINNWKIDLKNYLEVIKRNEVELSENASDLLKKYFVSSRKIRGGNPYLKSLEPLCDLTKAHAKLNFRGTACDKDAIAAIELSERALGPCPGLPQPPKELWAFENWLKTHILSF